MKKHAIHLLTFALLTTTTVTALSETITINCPTRNAIENRKYLQNEFVTRGAHSTVWRYRGKVGDFASAGREITQVPSSISLSYLNQLNAYEFVCNNIFRQRYMLTFRDQQFSFYSTARNSQGQFIGNQYQCKTTKKLTFECKLKKTD